MTACVHGDVCREYLRQHKGIIYQTCPSGCRFYEPEERTCHIECVKSGPFYDVFRFDCCGKEYSESRTDDGATELPLVVCPFCGAKVIQE